MKAELLLAYDDRTWETKVVEIPDESLPEDQSLWADHACAWFQEHLQGNGHYDNVVLAAVYDVPFEPDGDTTTDDHNHACARCHRPFTRLSGGSVGCPVHGIVRWYLRKDKFGSRVR